MDESDAKFESLQWIKLSPFPNSKGLYRIKEVLSGLHDDDRRNRILIKLDHTLVIKKAKRNDSGSYFCTRNVTNIPNKYVPWNELQRWLVKTVHLKFYFHVDVLEMRHSQVLDVSEDATLKPKKPESISALNLIVYINWHPWSECTVCGEPGLRKRVGICTVKKLYKDVKIPNGYLEHLLKFAADGLPCQSELLRHFSDEKRLQLPNEVQIEECLVPCDTSATNRKRRSISKSELLAGEKKDSGKSKDVKVREGDSLIMVCPGSSITSLAVWINGTENIPLMALKKATNKRISYDPLGNLIFSPITLADAGVYSCWLKRKLKRKFDVKVTVDYTKEASSYSAYLGYVFLANFGLFVVLSIIKFMNRNVQIRQRKTTGKKTEEESSSDETTSLTNGFT